MQGQMFTTDGQFAQATPESQGIRSESIIKLLDTLSTERCNLHSIYVIRNGKLVAGGNAKPFTNRSYHRTQSAAKSIVSTAILLAIQEGFIGLDDKVVDYFAGDLPKNMDGKFYDLTVYHLLTMTTGHTRDTFSKMMDTNNWLKTFFSSELTYEPGIHWMYNNGVPHILGCLIKKVTNLYLPEFLKPRLLDPLDLDMQFGYNNQDEFDAAVTCVTPDTFVKLTLLYLQEGVWEGKQILDKELVRMASSALVVNNTGEYPDKNSNVGYGFQFWRNVAGGYRFSGGGGQYGMIFPEGNLAVVTMGFTPHSAQIPEYITDLIYYNMQVRPLPENPVRLRELRNKLEHFSLAPRSASAVSTCCEELSRKEFSFSENSIGLQYFFIDFLKDYAEITITQNEHTYTVPCAYHGNWAEYKGHVLVENDYSMFSRIYGHSLGESLISGGWTDNDTFQFNIRSHASMGTSTVICDYKFQSLKLKIIPARLRGRNPRTREPIQFTPIILDARK